MPSLANAQWRVVDAQRHSVEGEQHYHPNAALRAMWILNAHELKHGRPAQYSVLPATELVPIANLNLPDWALEALEALKQAGIE